MVLRLLPGLLLCLSLQAQTDARLWRYLHPDAKAVIGVDWGRFQQSAVWTMFQEKLGALPLPVKGLPFLKDIDRILLSSPGAPENSEGKKDAQVLIVVHGNFAPDSVRKALVEQGLHRQIYGKFYIYRPQTTSNQDLGFVVADAQTVLIGDLSSLCAALDRSEFTQITPGPTLTRAAVLDAQNDFWAVISNPNILAGDRLQGFITGDDLSGLGGGLEFGVSLREGFAFNVTLKTASEAMAKHLADQISTAVKLSLKDKPANPALAEMGKKLKIAAAGDTVSMNLHLTKEEMERSARLYQDSLKIQASIKTAAPKAPPPLNLAIETPPKTIPQKDKMVIRIEGLDGGTREVPFNH
ncbi:MAG TPA: hypothetical protein VKG25_22925 [Bryobacteraceae bacterium]|nr:hypothetical protein [Bryobacteraceae bacterium]